MIVDENMWRELELPQPGQGRSVLRLHPDSPVDVFLAVAHPGLRRMLIIRCEARALDGTGGKVAGLARTEGIGLTLMSVTNKLYELQIALTDPSLREVFSPLVADVASVVGGASSASAAISAVIKRFENWQALMRSISREGLGLEARRGLFGELLVLEQDLLPALGPAVAVRSWTGPTGTNQDFQLPGGAIECKAATGRRVDSVKISSERQLDGTGTPTLVLVQAVLDERQSGSGASLRDKVDAVREQLSDPGARADFDSRLVRSGYLHSQKDLYASPTYTVREMRLWEVEEGFPRLVESQLPEGVHDCSYTITVTRLQQFKIPQSRLGEVVRSQGV
ncbi:PD-(D/E)XK motif protein [Umezawaea sp. NPDC059074]|uniref:PD-(D/E)XK motif protein n=1 Tax=Umezawaea sp. NPDC059074 TaxID=3346716 RepID=UPI0036D115FC